MKALRVVDRVIEKSSEYGLVLCVTLMLAFSLLTIVLRWFGTSIHWLEPAVRHLVFIATFLGGVLATGRGTHIGIDILGKYFENKHSFKTLAIIRRLISITSCLTLIWLGKASYDFMLVELEYGKEVFLGLHSGVLVGIIPVGFGLIALRFLTKFIFSFTDETPCKLEQSLTEECC